MEVSQFNAICAAAGYTMVEALSLPDDVLPVISNTRAAFKASKDSICHIWEDIAMTKSQYAPKRGSADGALILAHLRYDLPAIMLKLLALRNGDSRPVVRHEASIGRVKTCARGACGNTFTPRRPSDPKRYCSQYCASVMNGRKNVKTRDVSK